MDNLKTLFTLVLLLIVYSQTESSLLEFLDKDDPDSTLTIAKIIHSNFEIWKQCDRICQEKFKNLALSFKSCNRALSFIIICLYDGGKGAPLVPVPSTDDSAAPAGGEQPKSPPAADHDAPPALPPPPPPPPGTGEDVPIISNT